MRSTYNQFYYINRGKVKADGTTAILCRVSVDGKTATLTTGLYCTPDEWNSRKGEVKSNRTNNELREFKQRMDDAYARLLKEQGVVSAELLKNTIVGVNTLPTTLLRIGEEELERLKERSVIIESRSTYRQSLLFQGNLRRYIQSVYHLEDMPLAEITGKFGTDFKLFMLKTLGSSTDKMNKNLCWLNRLIYIAVDKEIIRCNPLEDVEYEKKNPPKLKHISRKDLQLLMKTPFEDVKMELARRIFIFSSFTGFAYVDVKGLYPHHISETADGKKYIRKCRAKTDVEAFIPLHPVAERILSLYNTTDREQPVFPLSSRDVMWWEIHGVGVALGFKENLSYHQGRHNFGTLLVSAGISIESVAKMMGHTNLTSSQIYAKITDDKISKDMDELMERRKTKNVQSESYTKKLSAYEKKANNSKSIKSE